MWHILKRLSPVFIIPLMGLLVVISHARSAPPSLDNNSSTAMAWSPWSGNSASAGAMANKTIGIFDRPSAINWPNRWKVDFKGDSQWSKSVAGTVQLENIHTEGTANVVCDNSGFNCTAHVSQKASYLFTSSSPDCSGFAINRKWIGAPGQWSVYEDSSYWTIFTYQRLDGTYGMALPFSLSRPYDLALHQTGFNSSCAPFDFTGAGGYQDPWTPLVHPEPNNAHELTFTVPSNTFVVDRTWLDNSVQPPATRHYFIRATPQYGCNGRGPINGDWGVPIKIQLDSDFPEIRPDGAAILTAHVTCSGVPVKNAQINFETRAAPNTGYHLHGDTLTPRPNGCLDGVNRQNSVVSVVTDDQGEAQVTFQPGTLEACGTPRGIAGRYRITARSARYPEIYSQRFVDVARHDLISAAGLQNTLDCLSNSSHSAHSSGTGATIGVLNVIGVQFSAWQVDENQWRVGHSLPPWPIQDVPVGNLSLPTGGLFDVHNDWAVPYRAHAAGSSIDFIPSCWSISADQSEWLVDTLLSKGSAFGPWSMAELGEWPPAYHLDVAQPLQLHRPEITAPDIAVVAQLSGPAERLVAAPGQTVSYTIGVDNLAGTADATNVSLTTTLPVSLTFISANPASTRLISGQVAWDAGTLVSGTLPQLYHVSAQVGAGVVPGTLLTVTALTTTGSADSNLNNNQFSAGGLLIRPPGPDLAVRSSLAETALTVDRPVTFTLDAVNLGTLTAPNVALTLTLPASVTLRSANPVTASQQAGVIAWSLGNLTPGQGKSVTAAIDIAGDLIDLTALDSITNTPGLTISTDVSSSVADLDPSNNAYAVVKPVELAGPDVATWLSVAGIGPSDNITVGQNLTYTLHYGNWGNQIAQTTSLTLSMETGFSVIDAQPAPTRTTTSTVFSGSVSGWDLGDLDVNAWGTVQVRVHVYAVSSEGSQVIAAIQSTDLDIRPTNNIDSESRSTVMTYVYLPLVLK